jgi:hypothetical protein
MPHKTSRRVGIIMVLLLIAAQFIRPDRTNPPIDPTASFEAVGNPTPEVAAIVKRACSNCHSYNTTWPWYSQIAPASWLIANDVKGGRVHLNFSEWRRYSPDMARTRLKEACEEIKGGDMPPWYYRLLHPEAKLSTADREILCGASTR